MYPDLKPQNFGGSMWGFPW
ncbi:rCG52316 [Rattus norvegicus]|uniref:RCG52316 n=1 Tax=Rattus norvegicus TaxID=10116 RepID=A6K0U3_RAT|nr:rCG52316 [Rattus norvegicus]